MASILLLYGSNNVLPKLVAVILLHSACIEGSGMCSPFWSKWQFACGLAVIFVIGCSESITQLPVDSRDVLPMDQRLCVVVHLGRNMHSAAVLACCLCFASQYLCNWVCTGCPVV